MTALHPASWFRSLRTQFRTLLRTEISSVLEEMEGTQPIQARERRLRLREAAPHLQVRPDTIRGWIKFDNCPHSRVGTEYRVSLEEVRAWLHAHPGKGPWRPRKAENDALLGLFEK